MTPTGREQERPDPLGPAQQRHLSKAPITEAIIDFRVQPREGVSVQDFEQLRERLAGRYPKQSVLSAFQTKVGLRDGMNEPRMPGTARGTLFRSADDKVVAQFRVDGFAFNRLAPYTSWEEIYPEGMALWRAYAEAAQPKEIVRLGARYINRLRLPLPVSNLHEYLTEPPRVPEHLPQMLGAYMTRLLIQDSRRGQSATVLQSLEPAPTDPNHVVFLLDIDAFKDLQQQPLNPTDEQDIDRILNALHQFKNDIFFGSITQQASELFE